MSRLKLALKITRILIKNRSLSAWFYQGLPEKRRLFFVISMDERNFSAETVFRTCQIVVTADGTRSFQYDPNGNMTVDRLAGSIQRRFDYTPFNKARRLVQIAGLEVHSSDFHYGPDRSRFLQRKIKNGQVGSRTHYIGSVEFEYQGLGSFVIDQIRRDGGGLVLEDIGLEDRSHLRSIVALSKPTARCMPA